MWSALTAPPATATPKITLLFWQIWFRFFCVGYRGLPKPHSHRRRGGRPALTLVLTRPPPAHPLCRPGRSRAGSAIAIATAPGRPGPSRPLTAPGLASAPRAPGPARPPPHLPARPALRRAVTPPAPPRASRRQRQRPPPPEPPEGSGPALLPPAPVPPPRRAPGPRCSRPPRTGTGTARAAPARPHRRRLRGEPRGCGGVGRARWEKAPPVRGSAHRSVRSARCSRSRPGQMRLPRAHSQIGTGGADRDSKIFNGYRDIF